MEQKAARPPLRQGNEEESMPTSSSAFSNNTQEDQAQTHHPIQPLGHVLEGERTTSSPPGVLEKAMDPSPGSPPSTPSASSFSSVSRSSTLSSLSTTQTHESDTTDYSQSSLYSDDTTSLYKSLTLPSRVSYPYDRNPSPRGASVRVFELPKALLENHPIFPNQTIVSIPMEESGFGRINRHLTWPDRQDVGRPAHNHQSSPLRHLTFPIEGPRDSAPLHDAASILFEGSEDPIVPEPSNMSGILPETVITSDTDMYYAPYRKEMPPDEDEFYTSDMQTEIVVNGDLIKSENWMFGSLDSKHVGLYREVAANPSTECVSQRRNMLSRKMPILQGRKAAERVKKVASQLHRTYSEKQHSPERAVSSSANTPVTLEAAVSPKDINLNRKEFAAQAEASRESRSSSPSPPDKPCGESNRESSSSDSDDNASRPHEDASLAHGEDEDSTYDELVESITNLVLESSCVGNIEDLGVPVKLYVHNLLEQILNHPKSPRQSQTLCLPIRNLPMPNNKPPKDAGESGMCAGGQPGNGGGSGTNKRKSGEAPSHSRNGSYGGQDKFGEDFGDLQSHNPQVKKPRTGKQGGNYSCPFRKRNPLRFNVRDHGSCAFNHFADFALLKRHIKIFHQKPNSSSSCVRCKEPFPDQAALNHHLTRPDICPVRDVARDENPEDGITEEVDRALKVRTKDDNVRLWVSLWNLLFPMDPPDRIPGPEHEPPVELDEVQKECYEAQSVHEFIHKEMTDGRTVITDHGFRYMVERFDHCRNQESREPSKERFQRNQCFVHMVQIEISTRQSASQAQQTRPVIESDPPPGFEPNRWGHDLNESFSLGGFDLYASLSPYPTEPPYASHVGVNGPQVPASAALYSSSEHGAAYHAGPQNAPTTLSYGGSGMVPPNGSPCPAAEGSAHRSSGPSSQSFDSSYQTQGTQDTQDTQYTQQHGAAFGDLGGAFAFDCSLSPDDIPSNQSTTTIQGHGSTEQIVYGAGTSTFPRPKCLDGSNSDDDGAILDPILARPESGSRS